MRRPGVFRRPFQGADNSRGFSLIEVMMATAIFVVIISAALLIYESSSRTFKRGLEAADTQQTTRAAFGKLMSDVRMSGFDYDRDGFPAAAAGAVWSPSVPFGLDDIVIPTSADGYGYQVTTAGTMGSSEPPWPAVAGRTITSGTVKMVAIVDGSEFQQPDEPIEYAGPAAITIRANLDYEEDAADDHGREPKYENNHFPVVTTGNDEIVTYALRSADNSKNTESVGFYADVNLGGLPARRAYPGGRPERFVTVPDVDTTNDNPPYTLYRFTISDDGNVVSSPLADNIRSMSFLYFEDFQGVRPLTDLSGTERPDGATIWGLGKFDPASATALVPGRAVRSRIRSIRIRLTGMTDQPDPAWDDGDPAPAARHYRKVTLDSLVVPRNIGKHGIRETEITPPGLPVLTGVCFGHCSIAHLRWKPPPTGGAVERYAVLWDTDNVDGFANITQAGTGLSADIPLPDPTRAYYFTIEAINSYGSAAASAVYSGVPGNATKPDPPGSLSVSPAVNENIVSWTAPTENVASSDVLSCMPGGTMKAPTIPSLETIYYRIFRDSSSPSFDPSYPTDSQVTLWDETRTGLGQPALNVSAERVEFKDNRAANCVTYYYRVQALDGCGAVPERNVSVPNGFSESQPAVGRPAFTFSNSPPSPMDPSSPGEIQVRRSSCSAGRCTVELMWPRVTTDTAAGSLTVDSYIVRRQKRKSGLNVGAPVDVVYAGESNTSGETLIHSQSDLMESDIDAVSFEYEFKVAALNCSRLGEWTASVRTTPSAGSASEMRGSSP